jgi:hypothetical protein
MLKPAVVASALIGLMTLGTSPCFADEGKDESGKGKQRFEERKRGDDRSRSAGSYFRRHGYTSIPNGHLPPPGECRIWYPERPPGQQPPPFKCGARARVEPGGWLMSPGPRAEEVEVAVYDPRRPGIVIDVAIFDARSGSIVRVMGSN